MRGVLAVDHKVSLKVSGVSFTCQHVAGAARLDFSPSDWGHCCKVSHSEMSSGVLRQLLRPTAADKSEQRVA